MPNLKKTKWYKIHLNGKSLEVSRGYSKKKWESMTHKIMDQDTLNWYIQNDLPLDNLFDEMDSKYNKNEDKDL